MSASPQTFVTDFFGVFFHISPNANALKSFISHRERFNTNYLQIITTDISKYKARGLDAARSLQKVLQMMQHKITICLHSFSQ